jgi:exopolysaccharide production protein ExoZ
MANKNNPEQATYSMEKSTVSLVRPLAYPCLEGVRFYAALIVFVEHVLSGIVLEYFKINPLEFSYSSDSRTLKALYYLADGNHGVDIFFIISGFLMTRLIQKSNFSYSSFVLARVKRIYPAFLVSLLITTLIVVQVFGWPWKIMDFLGNLIFLNAFPALGVMPYNHVSWSLGYEFAFYVIIPVLALVPGNTAKASIKFVILLAILFCIPTSLIRFEALFVGGLIGILSESSLKAFASKIPLSIAVIAYLSCGVIKALGVISYQSYYSLFLACAAVLFVRLVWRTSALGSFLMLPAMRTLGTLSYSLYLYHSVIASLVLYKLTPWPASLGGAVFAFLTTFVLTLFASYVSYMLFEKWYFNTPRHRASVP